jgi:uncharacterized protein YjbI with pentapeptide repeats
VANDEHVALLKQGVAAWNAWRDVNRDIRPDISEADLGGADLSGADLIRANLESAELTKANLTGAYLRVAHLFYANLSGANLIKAHLSGANLRGADLSGAKLFEADLSGLTILWEADLSGADLSGADLSEAVLFEANLSGANLRKAHLRSANFRGANLTGANLSGAILVTAVLVDADITGADLTDCYVYGLSAWGLKLEGTKQQNLIITKSRGVPGGPGLVQAIEPEITVDNIEVAQFVYILLHNEKIRDVIDTITSKAVLILGRFTPERKKVLDALREELRKHNYLPILFDFEVPAGGNITETVTLLARMARFIIADLTDPSSIPQELQAIVPHLAKPVQPLLEGTSRPFAMFRDYRMYDWVLPVHRYEGLEPLLATLAEKVIAPAEGKVKDLRRRMIEAELTKPQ